MAVKFLSNLGNQIMITYDDNSTAIAYPTNGSIWLVSGTGGGSGGSWVKPIDGYPIVSGFGPRESPGGVGSTNHLGVDFSGSGVTGKPILAASHGIVTHVEFDTGLTTGFGNSVIITHDAGETTLYGHMIDHPLVVEGQTVSAGDVIGNVGATGAATGPHLHFETRESASTPQVDPVPFMLARGVTL